MLRKVNLQGCYFDVNNYEHQELYTIANALGRLRDPKAVEPLIDVLRNSKGHLIGWTGINITAFEEVIEALGELGDPRATDSLTDLMNIKEYRIHDPTNGVQEKVKEALRKIRTRPSG
jgi:HEAT repeat protein